jgi:hypothetical protein
MVETRDAIKANAAPSPWMRKSQRRSTRAAINAKVAFSQS